MRRVRCLGPRRRRRQAHLLRPLRPPAPRPGVGRHLGQQRPPDPRLQGHGPGLPGLRRVHARGPQGSPRGGPLALLHDRGQHLAQRPADVPAHGRRLDRAGPQRQPDQHPRPPADGRRPAGGHRARLRCPQARDQHQRHLPGDRAPGGPPGHLARGARGRAAPEAAGRLLLRLDGRVHAVRRPRPPGHPAARARSPRARLGGGERDRGPRHRRCVVHPRDRARRDDRRRRAGPAQPHLRQARAQGLPLRVRLPRPARHPHLRPAHPQRARGDRPPAGQGLPGRRRPGHPRARVRHPRRHRVRRGQRHPLRHRPGEELLRRAHLHPAQPDDPPARHPAQAEPACAT